MALIKCPECGKEISDTAKNCIHCGYALKEEIAAPPQTIVNVEAPKKVKSSSKYLVIGITLFLCALIFATVIKSVDTSFAGVYFDEPRIGIPIIALGIAAFVFSLVLLAVPKLRKKLYVVLYLILIIASSGYIFYDFDDSSCTVLFLVPLIIALFVSYVMTFISLFIKDEK